MTLTVGGLNRGIPQRFPLFPIYLKQSQTLATEWFCSFKAHDVSI